MIDRAMGMTFLANLGQFEQSFTYSESRSYRKRTEVKPFSDNVLTERTVINIGTFRTEGFDFLKCQQADLSVPFTC